MAADMYLDAQRDYAERGYTIYSSVLPPTLCQAITASILEDSFRIISRDLDVPLDPTVAADYLPLVDSNVRKERGIPDSAIWLHNNPRTPIYSKSTGMINIYRNPMVLHHLQFNPEIFLRIANLYGHNDIGFTKGVDRVGFKIRGSVDMPTHLDYHLFSPDGEDRVQAFFTCSVPSDVVPRDSGTIQVIPYFHHYWDIARIFFRPDGPHALTKDEYRASIPQPWGPGFNRHLAAFNAHLEQLHRDGALNSLPVFHELKWTPIQLNPGDLLCWDHRLPHGNLRNKSVTPRVVAYISLFPFPAGFHRTEGDSGAGTNRDDGLERAVLRRDPGVYVPTEIGEYGSHFATLEEYAGFCRVVQGVDL